MRQRVPVFIGEGTASRLTSIMPPPRQAVARSESLDPLPADFRAKRRYQRIRRVGSHENASLDG